MHLLQVRPDQARRAVPAQLEGDVDGGGHVEDLERRVALDQLVDEDADAAADGAPVLERADHEGRAGGRVGGHRRSPDALFDCRCPRVLVLVLGPGRRVRRPATRGRSPGHI